MSKVIQVKFAPATATKVKRCIANSDAARIESDWNYELTDSANYRLAANRLITELNSMEHNYINRIKFTIMAGGMMPDGKSYVYIMEEV